MQEFTDSQIQDARNRWDIIGAEVALKRKGRELQGLCPFHNEKSPSFYINPDKGFFHCFGCGAHGTVVDYVMRTHGLEFKDAVRSILGLPEQRPREHATRIEAPAVTDRKAEEGVEAILKGCGPITETSAAFMYLHLRGIPPAQPGLFYHPGLECFELGRDERGDTRKLPAIVAPITDSQDKISAILRTWVVPRVEVRGESTDPKDNRALLRTRKKGLGRMGDGAVRLARADRIFGLAEGWETACSARELFSVPVWATCGTARFGFPGHWQQRHTPQGERPRLWIPPDSPNQDDDFVWIDERPPTIWLPHEARQVVIFGDNGDTGHIVSTYAAAYWRRELGIKTHVRFPKPQYSDFNDQLLAKLMGHEVAA